MAKQCRRMNAPTLLVMSRHPGCQANDPMQLGSHSYLPAVPDTPGLTRIHPALLARERRPHSQYLKQVGRENDVSNPSCPPPSRGQLCPLDTDEQSGHDRYR